jgi:integrase
MPMNVQSRGKKAQLRVTHKLLPKAFFFTFESESEARSYGQQLVALLDRGVVPGELLAAAPKAADDLLIVEVIRAYTQAAPITDSDDQLLTQIMGEVVGLRVSGLTWAWVDRYVNELKLKRHLAPSTIRKRVGVLGRVMDWHLRRVTPKDQPMPANPLRLLPRGYSTYSRADADALAKRDLEPRRDQHRDRRLLADEEARIRAALAGEKREDRERALTPDVEFTMLFDLLVHTGLRLREAYRLRVDQIDLARGIIRVEGSKGHRGAEKPRTVPLVPVLRERLQAYLLGRRGLMFGFWDGTDADLKKATARLSARFAVLFDYAKVPDFTEHDLRHEATCRWVEMRSRTRGGWAFSEVEVCRIMGWSDTRMMLRYASLRGEDLAARLA